MAVINKMVSQTPTQVNTTNWEFEECFDQVIQNSNMSYQTGKFRFSDLILTRPCFSFIVHSKWYNTRDENAQNLNCRKTKSGTRNMFDSLRLCECLKFEWGLYMNVCMTVTVFEGDP